jgi:hypothetical protein
LMGLQQQIAGQAATIAQLQAQPAGPPAAIVPMLTPGDVQGPINLGVSEGIKLHKLASAALGYKLEGKVEELRLFTNDINVRASNYGWHAAGLFRIDCGNGVFRNLLTEYALVTKDNIDAHVNTYTGTMNRTEQSSRQLHMLLHESVDPALKTRLIARQDEYSYPNAQGVPIEDGVAMLKLLLVLINVDTRASVSMLEERVERKALAVKFRKLDYNIIEFNLYVSETIQQLLVRGQQAPSLVSKLLRPVLNCTNFLGT